MTGQLYAEDIAVGETTDLGCHWLSHEEIVEFARLWDPQDFHLDGGLARSNQFGEVIASGLQTMGVLQRLAVQGVYGRWHIIAGRAIRDVQFTKAVTAGLELRGRLVVASVDPVDHFRSLVTVVGALDAGDDPVLRMDSDIYVRRGIGDGSN